MFHFVQRTALYGTNRTFFFVEKVGDLFTAVTAEEA